MSVAKAIEIFSEWLAMFPASQDAWDKAAKDAKELADSDIRESISQMELLRDAACVLLDAVGKGPTISYTHTPDVTGVGWIVCLHNGCEGEGATFWDALHDAEMKTERVLASAAIATKEGGAVHFPSATVVFLPTNVKLSCHLI